MPSRWQDWQRWSEGVDWSDWRSWLERVASADWTDWAPGPLPGAPWEQAPQAGAVSLTVRAFGEDEPGDRIREHLTAAWPAFRRWWREGANARPTGAEASARLEEHMPELVCRRVSPAECGPGRPVPC